MRAPFNTTVTLLDGPGTATPGFPRVVDAPARLVPDPEFRTQGGPESASMVYLTMDAAAPIGPLPTDTGGGVWTFDYSKADRAQVANVAGVTWVVVRVELCTPPTPEPSYYRLHLVADLPPLTPCQMAFGPGYIVSVTGGADIETLFRIAPTVWIGRQFTLLAEVSPVVPGTCLSTWTLTKYTCTWAVLYDGIGTTNLTPSTPECGLRSIRPAP